MHPTDLFKVISSFIKKRCWRCDIRNRYYSIILVLYFEFWNLEILTLGELIFCVCHGNLWPTKKVSESRQQEARKKTGTARHRSPLHFSSKKILLFFFFFFSWYHYNRLLKTLDYSLEIFLQIPTSKYWKWVTRAGAVGTAANTAAVAARTPNRLISNNSNNSLLKY